MTRFRKAAYLGVVLIVLCLCASDSSAECMTVGSLNVWPEPGSIPANAVFLVEADWKTRKLLERLFPCELSLVSGSDRICLREIASYVGALGPTQVLFQPERLLTPGKTYTLTVAESLQEEDWNSQPPITSLRWTADQPADHVAPQWADAPRVGSTEYTQYGCGPAILAHVSVPAVDDNPTMALVAVRRAGAEDLRQYLFPLDDSSLRIGKGMCSGEFDLETDVEYEAQIKLMDVAGNSNESESTIRFKIPSQTNE